MIDYIIVNSVKNEHKYYSDDSDEGEVLAKKVRKKIEKGYIPAGGIASYYKNVKLEHSYSSGATTKFEPQIILTQAMTKEIKGPYTKKGFE